MSETITLEATLRADMGKGASRRLRRGNGVPAIIYGGKKKPASITLKHNEVYRCLEEEAFFSSILSIDIEGKKEKAVLKALQRHPYKQQILHLDLQRVSQKEVLTRSVPIHFINEESCVGIKQGGGIASHQLTELEISCQASLLPSHIDIDVENVELDGSIHLSDIKLPKGVELTADISDSAHDHPVFSVHLPKVVEEVEDTEELEASEAEQEEGETAEAAQNKEEQNKED